MRHTRRGFLKTLGKLGAAMGLTAAAYSAHHPHTTPKAKPRTTRSGEIDTTTTFEQIKFASNVTVTNRPNVTKAVEMTSRHQEWLNRLTMARIDNISMVLNPQILLKDFMPDNS